ncbi:hypothetical protein SAMD00019534_073020 [Acytostelium subglobosum LB1]|uniref:hypothetical protein n=1 Tax=Acytostelium subglobosum LB1 TaxID=1410327 RepID=UPI0006451C47|nr:hypothetical protein SAMD00019534_073020 [Acytostelium subglobosum LB1]GAM24127.1 hypothetical protein SAMD00019534_073020 [Acytostelium subglobosum LB1]|eukprot:XP_012753163.1 hypothetical protein SAMD00019534_073020 [Acytostelium subglobosum LB1]
MTYVEIIWICCSLILLSLAWIINEKIVNRYIRHLPPGPTPWPIIGNLHLVSGSSPHHVINELSLEHGPVMRLKLGAVEAVVFSDPDALRTAFIDDPNWLANRFQKPSASAVSAVANITYSNGDYNRMLRTLALSGIGPTVIKKHESHVMDEINKLCQHIDRFAETGEPVNPIPLLKICTLNIMMRLIFSVTFPYDGSDREATDVIDLIDSVFKVGGAIKPSDYLLFLKGWYARSAKGREYYQTNIAMSKYVEQLVKRRQVIYSNDRPGQDILDTFLKEHAEGRLDMRGVCGAVGDLLVAGTDTSANTISALIKAMANRPDQQAFMHEELRTVMGDRIVPTYKQRSDTEYTVAAIKEAMRRFVVAPFGMYHVAAYDGQFRGYTIKANTLILQNIHGSMLTESVWLKPLEFHPERFINNAANVNRVKCTFGSGPRNCLGMALAEQELYLLVATLFRRYRFSKPPPTSSSSIEFDESMLFGVIATPTDFDVHIIRRS